MIKDVIRMKWEGQHSHEQIAAALRISKGAVAKYLALAAARVAQATHTSARHRGKLSQRSSSLIDPEILSNQAGPALLASPFWP